MSRSMRWTLPWACFLCACNGGNGAADTDAGDVGEEADDDDAPDADGETGNDGEAGDADGDGGDVPPVETYCRSCRWDDECGGEGSICVAFGGIEMSCVPPCEAQEDCPSGAECTPRGTGRFCLPVARTCIASPLGSICRSWGCDGRYDLCSDPAGTTAGFCTRACERDVDCDPGYNVCGDRGDGVRVCLRPPGSPPERCGAAPPAEGFGASCAGGTACGAAAPLCLADVAARLPPLCSIACDDDADCPGSARCRPVAGSAADPRRVCLPDECDCRTRLEGSMLDDALDALGIDRCDMFYSSESLDRFGDEFAHDRFRLPWFDDVHREWLRGERFVRGAATTLDAASRPRGVLLEAAALLGRPIEDRPFEPPVAPAEPLVEALAGLIGNHGGTPNRATLRTALASVPAGLAAALAPVAIALDRAAVARDTAVARIAGSPVVMRNYFNGVPSLVLPGSGSLAVTSRQVQDFLIDDFGYVVLFQAAADLLASVEAADLARFRGTTGFDVRIETPIGLVVLRDGADTRHDDEGRPILLALDTGGNDTWRSRAGATTGFDHGVSLAIDLGGADAYGYEESPSALDVPPRLPSDEDGRYPGDGSYGPFSLSTRGRQGSGTLGIGILLDLGAEGDVYRSLRMSQGWGALGVGILYDAGGDDSYGCEAGCAGAALFGIGLLIDDGNGTDAYEGYHAVQGFAYVRGAGILYDAGGNDGYLAQPDDVLYYNPQDPGLSNSSMAQGMGFGRRSDVSMGGDGVYMSGGIGILRDRDGEDTYECAIFCQGSGYWFGLGLLADGGGPDRYDARWYVQGGAAHYAVAALWDASGNDVYNEHARRLNVTLGGGHDFSNAFLLDDDGDDVYFAPNLSLGAGNEDGFGLLLDRRGDDAYTCSSNFSLGNAHVSPDSGARRTFPTAGLFLDADGTDTWDRPDTTLPANDAVWTQRMHAAETFEYGAGVDRTAGVTGL